MEEVLIILEIGIPHMHSFARYYNDTSGPTSTRRNSKHKILENRHGRCVWQACPTCIWHNTALW